MSNFQIAAETPTSGHAGPGLQDIAQLLSTTAAPLKNMKDRKRIPQISIPGMSTVCGDGSKCRRLIWCFFLVSCTTIATIQVKLKVPTKGFATKKQIPRTPCLMYGKFLENSVDFRQIPS